MLTHGIKMAVPPCQKGVTSWSFLYGYRVMVLDIVGVIGKQ